MTTTTRIGIALAAVLATPLAIAQGGSWYAGGSAGRSTTSIDDAGIRRGLGGQGLATATLADRDASTGYKLFGGYELTPNVAIEAGVFDLGRFGYTATSACGA